MTSPDAREVARRASLKDVAALADVSFQTVSKVLRGQGTVTAATRTRIEEAAEQLGYVPDEVARSLVARRSRTLGLIVGDLSDHVVARFVPGVEREARRRGHALVIVNLEHDASDGERSVQTLLSRRVAGIVAAAPQLEDDARLGALLRSLPSVGIHAVVGGGIPLVGSDQRETGRLATSHLLGLGHRRVGMVAGPQARHVTRSRMEGWARAHRDHGVHADRSLLEEGDWTPQGGYDAATRLLARAPDVTGLFVHNDLMAVGALHALSDRGRAVPGDVALVGCDDVPVAAHTIPPLSTVRLPFAQTGVVAVQTLLTLVAGAPPTRDRYLLPVELTCRASCGCDPASPGPST